MNTYHPHTHHASLTATAERSQAHASRRSGRARAYFAGSQSRTWTGPSKADRRAPAPLRRSTIPPTSANVRRLASAIAPLTTSWCSLARWISSSFRPACRSAERANVPTSQPRRTAVTARKPDVGLCARGDARNAQQADGAVIYRGMHSGGVNRRWAWEEAGGLDQHAAPDHASAQQASSARPHSSGRSPRRIIVGRWLS